MAVLQHTELVKKGIYAINRWHDQSEIRQRLDLSGALLSGLRLSGADLANADLSHADLTRADLRRANLSWSDLESTHMWRADLSRTDMRNARLPGAILGRASLCCSFLREVDLHGADLSSADLSYADLAGSNLTGADLTEANLSWADLTGAKLVNAKLTATCLDVANLSGADLRHAQLVRTRLDRTLLAAASLEMTLFADCDLSQALGLDSVRHFGPSVIGVDSLARSRGGIPYTFLNQAGVAPAFITLDRAAAERRPPTLCSRILLASVVSDEGFADMLAADLRAAGLPCWSLPVDDERRMIAQGSAMQRVMYYDVIVAVCSEEMLGNPHGVRLLEYMARNDYPGKATVSLALDQSLSSGAQELCQKLSAKTVVDFQGWRSEVAYLRGLEQLVRELSAKG
ncbi:MAG: pentapeptide repeat-containing protein [SAR202 cluster bacterium]|nr:pentapeptide repeat-containing protein [SAR202 cluster bacterium]